MLNILSLTNTHADRHDIFSSFQFFKHTAVFTAVFVCKCFLLSSVTEDHPEVKAMVLSALEHAKYTSTSPLGLYAEVLEKRIKEVCQKV